MLDETIEDIRDQLKVKVNDLRRLEGKPELKGYDLTPLSRKELHAIKNIVPEVVNSDIWFEAFLFINRKKGNSVESARPNPCKNNKLFATLFR